MSFYSGELSNFNLCKMQEDMKNNYLINKYEKYIGEDNIVDLLKEYDEVYYFFGKREDECLSCINGKTYVIDDIRDGNSNGIYMGDAYFNIYEDINLGFLISYRDGRINIEPALEGESTEGRIIEVIEDCGDLNTDMIEFINKYII